MEKIKALMALFRKGQVVLDPTKWKNRQLKATALAAALYAGVRTAEAWGVDVPLEPRDIDALAVAIIAGVNFVLTLTTSEKVGLQDKRGSGDNGQGNA